MSHPSHPFAIRIQYCRAYIAAAFALCLALLPAHLVAGGPKFVAGTAWFNPAVAGQPLHWSGGVVRYFVDQGPLSGLANQQQATAMVDAAASLWSAIPTDAVTLTNSGSLNEDVSGVNILPGNGVLAQPSDVAPSAVNYPLAVVFDADGSIIEALFGSGASDPNSCQNNGVLTWLDNFNPDATIAHGVILLNGLCATTTSRLQMMSFQLERAFGRVLGLDYAQVNPGALTSGDPNQALGMAVMQPLSGACGSSGGICIPQPNLLRFDDIAALDRIYPITAANLASFPGKQLTAANTVALQGTITFRDGTGMQGVNVVARPLDANGNPLYQYAVTAVSGVTFNGKRGNPVSGFTDANGDLLTKWGSNDPILQGFFDLSGMPLPPGMMTATYQVTFEPINRLYMLQNSVGPYVDGSPAPSGTMPTLTIPGMSQGSSQTLDVNIADSATGGSQDAIANESAPRALPPSGQWTGRLSQPGQTDWFLFPVRAGHMFTVVTQALNENGAASESKALPTLGVWSAFAAPGSASEAWAPALNGNAAGESFLSILSPADDVVRLGIADMRGDGRPDYVYNAWVLYADTVQPLHLPPTGGPIVIHGTGFRPSDTVFVGGKQAVVTSSSPNEITAIAPAASPGVSGSVDVEVDDLPIFSAFTAIPDGLSYDAGSGDALTLVTAPSNIVPTGVPLLFTVKALNSNLKAVGGVSVVYSVVSGSASLACGLATCTVSTSGDGIATINVTATNNSAAIVKASLSNGASLQAHFSGGVAPILTALTPTLSVATGATVTWTAQAIVLNNGVPMSGQSVAWQNSTGAGIVAQGSTAALSNGSGIASKLLTVGPLVAGQQVTSTACVNGTNNCVTFTAIGARTELAYLEPIAGTAQSISVSSTPALIAMRVRDSNGNPMAGGAVTLYQALYAWTPACPPHGRCPAAQLLSTQVSTSTSAIDGSVTFAPASLPGTATNTTGLATVGSASTLSIAIEQHP